MTANLLSQLVQPVHLMLHFEPMDQIHREFLALCANLKGASQGTYLGRLDALIAHTVLHFDQENQWMHVYDFPSAGCHRREHDAVLDVLRDVRKCTLEGDFEVGVRLAQELPKWFSHHVDTMDASLAKFLLETDAAATATP